MDGSESSTLCQKYFCEYLCPFFVECVEKPHEHVFEASIGYHSYGGWPPIEKDRGTFQKKRFCIQPTISSDGAGVAKTFGHSGGSCDYPRAVVVGLKLSEINNPDIMLFDKAQYWSDGDSVKEIKIFWKKIVSKGVPLQDFEYNAPTKFFVDSAQIKAMDEGLKAFVDEELRKPIYEGLSYGDLHNKANPERKKLAAKLRKIIREKHSYRAGHGFVRPGIGGLLVWLRSCRLHAEQNFVKLLAVHMVLLCAKWDAAEGALETIAAGLANSRCEAMLKEFGAPFQLRRVCKRLLQTLEENGRSTTFGLFTWRFKSQDPQVYLNIFQNIWDSAFNFTKDTDTDFVFARHILFIAHRLTKEHSMKTSKKFCTSQDTKIVLITGSDIMACLSAIQAHVVHSSFVYLKELGGNMVRDSIWAGRPLHQHAQDGQSVQIQRSVAPGLNSQLEGGEKTNGVEKQAQYLVTRVHEDLWPALKRYHDFSQFVAESAYPQEFKFPPKMSRTQSRFWLEFDIDYSECVVNRLQLKESLSPRDKLLLNLCCVCVEALSCYAAHVVTRDYEYKSEIPSDNASRRRLQKELAHTRRNVFAMSAKFNEDQMHICEQLDASYNAPKERNPPPSTFSAASVEETEDLLDVPVPSAVPLLPPPRYDTRKRSFRTFNKDL